MTISTHPIPDSPPTYSPTSLPAWWSVAWTADQFHRLDPAQCRRLLHPAGQGGLSYPQDPHTVQVAATYRVTGHPLLITPERLSALTAAPLVTSGIDHLDVDRQHGWTIMATGRLRALGSSSFGADTLELALDLLNPAGRSIATTTHEQPAAAA